jgi:hypothetical protein
MGEGRDADKALVNKPEGNSNLKNLEVDGRIKKWNLSRMVAKSGLIWLSIAKSGGLFERC